jgi:hypothetical protein
LMRRLPSEISPNGFEGEQGVTFTCSILMLMCNSYDTERALSVC